VELRSKGYVRVVGAGPTAIQMPYSWGSHASRLTKILLEGHGNPEIDRQVKLHSEGFDRIVTWIDINAPYYPEYAAGAYRDHPFGRSPLDDRQLERIAALTGVKLQGANMGQVSFNRPEVSPCLAKLDCTSAQYREALDLIQVGKDNLDRNPRPDMPDFQLIAGIELDQQKKYDALQQLEILSRKAVIQGSKNYDHP
jgi:hypothetical protein